MKKKLVAICLALFPILSIADVPTVVKREASAREVRQAVHSGALSRLEAQAALFRKNRQRADDGIWMLTLFYQDLKDAIAAQALAVSSHKQVEEKYLAFARKTNSDNAWLMYATALNAIAWNLRGPGFRSTVTPEGWKGFKVYTERAKAVMDQRQALGQANPEWHATRLALSYQSGEDDARFEKMFMHAVKLEPDYYQFYFLKMHKLSPMWGGSIPEMVSFMHQATKLVSPNDGVAIYARLGWYADGIGYDIVGDAKLIDWALMKRAYHDVLSKYPTAWNAQKFFYQACSRPDKAQAQLLLKYFDEAPSQALFDSNVPVVQMCIDWARGKVPAFVMRDPETGANKLIE